MNAPRDWATARAEQIWRDALEYQRADAIELIAARLRLIRSEGACEGAGRMGEALQGTIHRTAAGGH